MKTLGRLIIISLILLAFAIRSFSQTASPQSDTLKVKGTGEKSSGDELNGNSKRNGNAQNSDGNTFKFTKQIRNGRPDMARSAGARPPVVVRPNGSGIPKGAGKPGGVGRNGGR
jgi:hypothetical protein